MPAEAESRGDDFRQLYEQKEEQQVELISISVVLNHSTEDRIAIFPIHLDGSEGRWQVSVTTAEHSIPYPSRFENSFPSSQVYYRRPSIHIPPMSGFEEKTP